MRLTSDSSRVATSDQLTYQGEPVKLIRKGGKNSRVEKADGERVVAPNHELWPEEFAAPRQTKKPGRKPGRRGPPSPKSKPKADLLEPSADTPKEHVEPRPYGEDRKADKYTGTTIMKAQAILKGYGFKKQPGGGGPPGSTLYAFKNPYTGQRANLSWYHEDKKGNKMDKATIVYHRMAANRNKRRTRQQKDRDNFVLYD